MADTKEGAPCDTFNANCVLIPWGIFRKLNNIDTVYTHSMGDFDYGYSASRSGVSIKVSDQFVGVCPDNPVSVTWRNTELSRKERLRRKESPKGLPGNEWFHYLKKNYNVLTAIVYSAIPYLRIVFKK
jgi:GT2 family glycosyltransferase